MPLLELRHVKPDEALRGNMQESNRKHEGRGKGLRKRASQISPRLSDTNPRSGYLPTFLSIHSLYDSIPYLNKPKSSPCPSKSGSECFFFQAGFYWFDYHIIYPFSHPPIYSIFPEDICACWALELQW